MRRRRNSEKFLILFDIGSASVHAMSWQMWDESSSSSSRRPRMNWEILNRLKVSGANGARSSAMPKLPNPEALLHHIDSAIANTEYVQASRHLSLLFPTASSTPPTSSNVTTIPDSEGSASELPMPSSTSSVAMVTQENRLQKPPVPLDLVHVKPTSRPRSASRFSSANHENPPNSQCRHSSVSGQSNLDVGDCVSNDGNSNGLWAQDDPVKANADMKTAVTQRLLLEELKSRNSDGKKTSGEALSTEFERAGRSGELPVRGSDSKELENYGRSSALMLLEPKDRVAKVDSNEEYDAQAADEAFRAGCSALSDGHTELAMSLLHVASSKCPPDKHIALAKIHRLMAATSQILVKQEIRGLSDTRYAGYALWESRRQSTTIFSAAQSTMRSDADFTVFSEMDTDAYPYSLLTTTRDGEHCTSERPSSTGDHFYQALDTCFPAGPSGSLFTGSCFSALFLLCYNL